MKPNRPNYGTYRFPRPSLTQRLDELAQRDPFLTGFLFGAIRYGYAYVAVERRDPDFPFVVSFNRQPCDVESTLPSGMRCIAIAKAA